MKAFRWPEMEERIRGVLREDAARWNSIRAERHRRHKAAPRRTVSPIWALMAALFVAVATSEVSRESTVVGGFALAIAIASWLGLRFIVALYGPNGILLAYAPASSEAIVQDAWAEVKRCSAIGFLGLLALHLPCCFRRGSLVSLAVPAGQWITALALAALLVQKRWEIWLRCWSVAIILAMMVFFSVLAYWETWMAQLYPLATRLHLLVNLPEGTWTVHQMSELLAWALTIPSLLLVASLPRSLRAISRFYAEYGVVLDTRWKALDSLNATSPPN